MRMGAVDGNGIGNLDLLQLLLRPIRLANADASLHNENKGASTIGLSMVLTKAMALAMSAPPEWELRLLTGWR